MNEDFINKFKGLLLEFNADCNNNCSNCQLRKIVLETGDYYIHEYDICDLLREIKQNLI